MDGVDTFFDIFQSKYSPSSASTKEALIDASVLHELLRNVPY